MSPNNDRPVLIGIAGGSGSGKTYFAHQVQQLVGPELVSILSMDQYFITEDGDKSSDINFDHPAHLDISLMLSHITALREGRSVDTPGYDFRERKRKTQHLRVEAKKIVLVEGLFVLAHPIVDELDLTCFLDVDLDQRLLGRILRDMQERDATISAIVDRYQRFVRPSYQIFVGPSMQNADVVVDFTYRRAYFLELFVSWVSTLTSVGQPINQLIHRLKGDNYRLGYSAKDTFMPIAVDIRDLSKAYPENAYSGQKMDTSDIPKLLLDNAGS